MFYLLMYTYNLFILELPFREVKIKSSFLMCYKKRVCKDSLISCLLRDSIGSVGLCAPLSVTEIAMHYDRLISGAITWI